MRCKIGDTRAGSPCHAEFTGWQPVPRETHGLEARATRSHGLAARATAERGEDVGGE